MGLAAALQQKPLLGTSRQAERSTASSNVTNAVPGSSAPRPAPLWQQKKAAEELLEEVKRKLQRLTLPNVNSYEGGEANTRYATDRKKVFDERAPLLNEKQRLLDLINELNRRMTGGEQ